MGSLHIHTKYSDGHATHDEIARDANAAGLDFVIATDHNIYVVGRDGWHARTLLLVGEEVHDVRRKPEANHYLCFNIAHEVVQYSPDPQMVIAAVAAQGGFGFIAHPFEKAPPFTQEHALDWVDWDVDGYAGLEIWNYMSEFKSVASSAPRALLAAYWPTLFMRGPFPETMHKWDELLAQGKRVAALGGPDAHAATYHLGPLRRVVFPYTYLFRALRMHILSRETFNHELAHDKALVYDALRQGRGFIAYDALADASGFRFEARGRNAEVIMGEEIALGDGVELSVTAPAPAELCLVRHGTVVAQTRGTRLTYSARQPGAYRIEAYRSHLFRRRAWAFTNPIYVREKRA